MVAVITKVGWNDEYQEIREWEEEMIDQEASLETEFVRHYNSNRPTIIAISKDLSKVWLKENAPGTEQNSLMEKQMKRLFDRALYNHEQEDSQAQPQANWIEAREIFRIVLKQEIEKILGFQNVQSIISSQLKKDQKEESNLKSYMSKKGTFKEKIKENTQPRVNTILS